MAFPLNTDLLSLAFSTAQSIATQDKTSLTPNQVPSPLWGAGRTPGEGLIIVHLFIHSEEEEEEEKTTSKAAIHFVIFTFLQQCRTMMNGLWSPWFQLCCSPPAAHNRHEGDRRIATGGNWVYQAGRCSSFTITSSEGTREASLIWGNWASSHSKRPPICMHILYTYIEREMYMHAHLYMIDTQKTKN